MKNLYKKHKPLLDRYVESYPHLKRLAAALAAGAPQALPALKTQLAVVAAPAGVKPLDLHNFFGENL